MDPEEKMLVQRTLKLAEDNNRILKKLHRAYKWTIVWGIIKITIIIVPLIAGYLYFQPLLEQIIERFGVLSEVLAF